MLLSSSSFSLILSQRIMTKLMIPVSVTQVRHARWIKPWSIGPEGEWKKLRGRKVIRVELPPFEEMRAESTMQPEEIRSKMKEKGVAPPIPYSEKPICISSSTGIFEPYIPPEGDGKQSLISKEGAKQRAFRVEKKTRSVIAIRKIRSFEEDWDPTTFAKQALDIYIKAHKALVDRDEDTLHECVTEYCYPEMTFNTEKTSIVWKFIDTLELPKVSHVRNTEMISKDNIFSQVTVRFHTRQILAIYDRFGRLMHGSDAIVKDVLEYVVFEKHLSHPYGTWRMHSKIIPDWMPPREPILKTFIKPPPPPTVTEEELKEKEELKKKQEEEEEPDKANEKQNAPALA